MSAVDRVLIAFVLGLSLAFAFVLDDLAEQQWRTNGDVSELREELHDGFDCTRNGEAGTCSTKEAE